MAMPETMSEEKSTGSPMGFLSRFVGIIVSPKRVFADIDGGAPWWQPWIWVSLINMIVAYVMIPIQIQTYRLRVDEVPKEQFDQTIAHMQAFPLKYLGIIVAPVMVLVAALVFSAASYIAVSVLSDRASFRKHFTIYLYGAIVASLGMLVSNIVVVAKGIENIRSFRDSMAPFGPAAFVPEGHKIPYAILSTLDVFSVWFYVLMVLGVMHVFRMSGRSAVLVVIPIWLLSVLASLVGARFGGAM
jgi:hypothetical protein